MSNRSKEEIEEKIKNDPDFIWSPKYDFSLEKFVQRYDEGIDNERIARVLLISEEEVEEIYQDALENLKKLMGANNDTE